MAQLLRKSPAPLDDQSPVPSIQWGSETSDLYGSLHPGTHFQIQTYAHTHNYNDKINKSLSIGESEILWLVFYLPSQVARTFPKLTTESTNLYRPALLRDENDQV